MGVRLKIPPQNYIIGGGVLTFVGTAANQPVYWSLLAVDPLTGYTWPAVGSLGQAVTLTDGSRCATNLYSGRGSLPVVRYGMGRKYGDGTKYNETILLCDQVTVKAVID